MVDTYPSFLDHRSESLASRTFRVEVVMARARVLVADDNQMRDILTSTLADEFDVIRAVSDDGAALAAATQLLPDVAILDISMPVLNGIEVARRIRDAKTNVAVVFVTACSDLDTFHAASETGCFAYVLKLRLCSDLVRAINLALSGTRFVSPGIG
jgi:DNA-binding NarL/FixJ family response regulator